MQEPAPRPLRRQRKKGASCRRSHGCDLMAATSLRATSWRSRSLPPTERPAEYVGESRPRFGGRKHRRCHLSGADLREHGHRPVPDADQQLAAGYLNQVQRTPRLERTPRYNLDGTTRPTDSPPAQEPEAKVRNQADDPQRDQRNRQRPTQPRQLPRALHHAGYPTRSRTESTARTLTASVGPVGVRHEPRLADPTSRALRQ